MLIDRGNEKKNCGKTTPLLPDDICGKLKDLDLRGSETTQSKLKVTDNFSKMKDLKKNDFGNEINKIGDKFGNIKIVDEEFNFPPKPKIVQNILCDNENQVNEKDKKQSNINFNDEQPVSNEKNIPEKDTLKEEKVYGKIRSNFSSIIHNEIQKEVVETTEKLCNVSDVTKKTEENEVLCSRGPVIQKFCQQSFQPYNTCSRSHHSGGIVRVEELHAEFTQPSHAPMNCYQQWHDTPQLNITPNQYASPMRTSFLPVTEGQTANINITSEYTGQVTAVEENLDNIIQQLLQENEGLRITCDELMRSKEEIGPNSPGDSGNSSIGSPAGSYQPPSVGEVDSVLGSPPHGTEYLRETLNENDRTEYNANYCKSWIRGHQKGQVAQERMSVFCHLSDQRGQTYQRPFQQGIPQRLFLQGIQQTPFPQGIGSISEAQSKHILQELPDRGQQNIQGQNIRQQNIQRQNISQPNIQGQNLCQQNIQGQNINHQIIQGQNMSQQSIQGQNISQQGIQGQNISQQCIQGQNISQPNFQGQNICQPNIQGQNISQSNIQGQNISQPNIQGQNISQPNIQGQNISQPNIQGQNISQPNIQGQNISQPNIQGQNISQPNIQEQNISQPNIQGQNISQQNIQGKTNIPCKQTVQEKIQSRQIVQEKTPGRQKIQEGSQGKRIIEKRPDLPGGQINQDSSFPCGDIIPQISGYGECPTKGQGTKYRPILPKPSSAKARFQQLLDKDRKLLAWLKINEKLIADPKQLEVQDAEGDTDLMIACCNKFESHLELIYAMVEKLRLTPNSLTIRNKQGHTALYLACKVLCDVPEVAAYIAEALVEQKVDIANMVYDGDLTLIQILEQKGDSHKKVLEGLLALKDSSGKHVFQPGNDVNANNFGDFNEQPNLLL